MVGAGDDAFPIDEWCLYLHSPSTSDTYGKSYRLLSRMKTLEQWARTWNNCHVATIGNPSCLLLLNKQCITTWSLFRDDVLPEWEHPRNSNGTTLTCRTNACDTDAGRAWTHIVLECIRGATSIHVLGVQVTRKPTRTAFFNKFDVWLSTDANIESTIQWLRTVTGLHFSKCTRHH